MTHWGRYRVQTTDGEVTAVDGVPEDPQPSPIGQNLIGSLRHPGRITAPAVRRSWLEEGPGAGHRGTDPFVEVSHAEAVRLVAGEIERVRREHGNQAIYAGSYGWGSAGRFHHAQSQVHRFFNAVGGYTRSVNTYSHAADEVILPHLFGDREWFLRHTTRWSEIAEHTDLFLAFGGLPQRSVQVNPGGVGAHLNQSWQERCARAGVRFVVVSPNRSDTSAALDAQWLAPRPCTDTALMLALCHTLLVEDRYDHHFVTECCTGFEQLRAQLLGQVDGVVKDAGWAADICDVDPAAIVELARRVAAGRTLVSITWSLQRQHHGEYAYWAAAALAAMSGSMGRPGGGLGTGFSSMHNAHVHDRVSLAASLPQLRRPVADFIPVARVADMLLHPGGKTHYDGATITYPDIKLVYWVGGNPFHHHQDLNRLQDAWQRPDTVVAHEFSWNALAKRADVVFPAATPLEREDIAIGMGDPWLSVMDRVAPPPPGVRSDYEIFADLAEQLGAAEAFTEGRTAAEWVRELYRRTATKVAELGYGILPTYSEFRAAGAVELPTRWSGPTAFSELRADPAAHPLATPSGKVELYSATIAGWDDAPPAQPVWQEPAEWLGGELAATYPLHLVSVQPTGRLHSQLDHGRESRRHKRGGREQVQLHPTAAAARDVADGDLVRVFNGRGACLAVAAVTEHIRADVVQLPTGSWFDPVPVELTGGQLLDSAGNPNVLTPDIGTSPIAQGPSAHTCLVQVERWTAPAPPVRAHEPPTFVHRSTTTRSDHDV